MNGFASPDCAMSGYWIPVMGAIRAITLILGPAETRNPV
jgi:hypothetical protein